MKKIIKGTFVSFLIFVFSVAPVSPDIFLINISKVRAINIEDVNLENIKEKIIIPKGTKFVIKEGTLVNFAYGVAHMEVEGELEINGTKDNPVIIKSNTYDFFSIITRPGSKVSIKNAEIIGGGFGEFLAGGIFNSAMASSNVGAIDINGGDVSIEDTIFRDNQYAIITHNVPKGSVKVNYSKFIRNQFDVEDYSQSDFTNNYWSNIIKTTTCINKHLVGNCFYSRNAFGNFSIYPWQEDENFVHNEGASNVLFLPGIKASHLYKYDSETDHDLDELWVPNWFGNDIEELKLDNDGKSIEKVFAKEDAVLQETVSGNLYKSFLTDLDKLKTDNVINNYKAFAYDWRQSVEDIAKNGTPYENNEIKSIVAEINNLAQNSKSGKVTIVAHSNGGLVAKATMMELERLNLADKVEKIIFVGTPQMGTPLAILSLLYGYEESLPTLLSQEKARSLVENMPGAYGLLPSDEYFSRTQEPIINFSSENTKRGDMFRDAYGESIDSFSEFKDFLLAEKDNREKPESDEINFENILNEKVLNEAIDIHYDLDNWTPPANVKVIQLAGWGLPTVNGINYADRKETKCKHNLGSTIPVCYETGNYEFIFEPKWTSDGDKVVAASSGLMMSNSDNLIRYWLDIKRGKLKIEHKNILENDNVRDFIKNEIQNNEADLPEYISTEKPADFEGMKPRIKMSLYSPLDIHIYDANGNHTGYKEIQTSEGPQRIIEENIPNSYYLQLGDRKYVGFEEGEDVEIKLDGYADGSYTLKIEEVKDMESGEEIINYITFKTLPTSDKTDVNLTIPASGLEDISSLKADYDGNGENDYILEPVLGQEITMPDTTPPVIEITSPENKVYYKDGMLNISYTVSDDRSEQDKLKTEILLDNQKIESNRIDLSFLKTGEHRITAKAEDEANNKSEKEIIFQTETNISTLKNNINHFYDLKLIKKNQEREMIINNLSVIEKEIEFYNVIKNNIFLKNKTKKILLEIIERQIENHIDIVIHKIKQDKKNYVTMIKEIIISDLEFIKNKY